MRRGGRYHLHKLFTSVSAAFKGIPVLSVHCHVDASPLRTEMMDRETVDHLVREGSGRERERGGRRRSRRRWRRVQKGRGFK